MNGMDKDAIEAIERLVNIRQRTVSLSNGGLAVIHGENEQISTYDPVNPPEPTLNRIAQHPTFGDLQSFVAYVNRYKHKGTRIWALPGFMASDRHASVIASFDYHLPSGDGGKAASDALNETPGGPQRCTHFATYRPRYSVEWQLWANERKLKQTELAEFIEEHRRDIRSPDAAALLDIIRTFKASRKVEFDSLVYQNDGSVKLAYTDTANASGSSTAMPEKLQLGIPVYYRGELFSVETFIRYRVGNGTVTFDLKPDRLDLIEDVAFESIVATVTEQTTIAPYIGKMS